MWMECQGQRPNGTKIEATGPDGDLRSAHFTAHDNPTGDERHVAWIDDDWFLRFILNLGPIYRQAPDYPLSGPKGSPAASNPEPDEQSAPGVDLSGLTAEEINVGLIDRTIELDDLTVAQLKAQIALHPGQKPAHNAKKSELVAQLDAILFAFNDPEHAEDE